jgi:teichuronic acid biosynthesis glycosyltransferase TuaG
MSNADNRRRDEIKFSVIIPTYNAERTIERAIESVLAQSYPAHEIIVVDDASNDGTVSILARKYAENIRLIQKTANVGSSIARNTGMDVATGNYIAFLDADDIWHHDKLMLLKTILDANPQIRLFYHPYTQEQIMGKRLPEHIVVYKLPFIKLLPANVIATSCAVISNDPSFRFDAAMRYTEDYDLWLRIGYKYKVYFIDIPLTQIFRPFTSAGGVSENKWKMRRGEMRAYTHLVKLNPLFILLLPFLLLSSLGKHLFKKLVPKSKNP